MRWFRSERDMEEEFRSHIEMRIRDNLATGMSPEQAHQDALRRFGNPNRIKDLCREIRGGGLMSSLWQDLRYATRMLAKSPGLTAAAVLSLALGIGANTAIFSVVNAVVLRPLPYQDSERLMTISEINPKQRIDWASTAPATVFDWKQQSKLFDDFTAFEWVWARNLTGPEASSGEPERIQGWRVAVNFFAVVGVEPILGRSFLPEDEKPEGERVVVLSEGLWRRHFGGDPAIVGRTVKLDDESHTVLGIMPLRLQLGTNLKPPDLWVPLSLTGEQRTNRRSRSLMVLGRIKPGVKLDQARAELDTIADRLAQAYPETNAGWRVLLAPLRLDMAGQARPLLFAMLGAVGFVLLIACVNVANLLTARMAARQREIAIRVSLGAGRSRLIRQLITESFPLVSLAAAGGLLLALWVLRSLLAIRPANLLRLEQAGVDSRVLGFTLGISLATVFLCSLLPALEATGSGRWPSGVQALTSGRSRVSLWRFLVVSEVALALVLLSGAGLMINTLRQLHRIKLGFDPHAALTMRITLSRSQYSEPAEKPGQRTIRRETEAFFQQVLQRLETLPGVEAVGAGVWPVLVGLWERDWVEIEGSPAEARDKLPLAEFNQVTPNYFRAMGIRLLSGRDFSEQDTDASPWVAVIGETAAHRFFPGQNPLGKRLRIARPGESWRVIVGVVGDVRQFELETSPRPQAYACYLQRRRTHPAFAMDYRLGMTLVLRAQEGGEPARLAGAARGAIRELSREAPIYEVKTLEEVFLNQLSLRRFYMLLLTAFAFLAMVLAAVGIYGVMAYYVANRTHEIGVRMALGAQAADVIKLAVGHALLPVLIGLGIGLGASLALTRVLASQLYGVKPTDPSTLAAVSLVLAVVALLASYLPARRAAKVDPILALRQE